MVGSFGVSGFRILRFRGGGVQEPGAPRTNSHKTRANEGNAGPVALRCGFRVSGIGFILA